MTVREDAVNAQNLLNDDFSQRALSRIKEDLKARIVATRAKDRELREELYNEYQGVLKFEAQLRATIDDGTIYSKRNER
jgi:hypothetical protein